MKELYIQKGGAAYLEDGTRIEAIPLVKPRVKIGSVAFHEATHSVIGELRGVGVKMVTNKPGPGYLGLTELSGFDPIAAAGPHAAGCDGTGHDLSLVEYSGYNVGSAVSVAKGMISENLDYIAEVASEVEEKGTIGGSEVRGAMKRVDTRLKIGEEVLLFVRNPNGSERKITKFAKGNSVSVSADELQNFIP